jgi:hypothetical protein
MLSTSEVGPILALIAPSSFLVGGDFNETLMPIYRKGKCKNGTCIQPVASLKTFIKTNNLTDIWRKLFACL